MCSHNPQSQSHHHKPLKNPCKTCRHRSSHYLSSSSKLQLFTLTTLTIFALLLQEQCILAGSISKGLQSRQRMARIENSQSLQVEASPESLKPVVVAEGKPATEAPAATSVETANYIKASDLFESQQDQEYDSDSDGEYDQEDESESAAAASSLAKSTKETKAQQIAGRYEIHSVSGEPNYKSVNLTWEVEFVPVAAAKISPTDNNDTITNSSLAVEPPKAFQIHYCEMQSFGPQRCRSKLLNALEHEIEDDESSEDYDYTEPVQVAASKAAGSSKQVRHYLAQIDNLRMATRYSFHIRPQNQRRSMKITARSEVFGETETENEIGGGRTESSAQQAGQTIIIPTKGFSAQATRCLPHASEIEVETGPYFGGKIVVDGGNCGIKGNPNDPIDKYTFRIDHKMCGSMVKPETNTVETFITVQENLGIFTYSTRRFVVVCSYQSGMQTVRASFTVPGKGGVVAALDDEPNDPFIPDDRMGREQRVMRFVNKSELVLKETSEDFDENTTAEQSAIVQEVEDPDKDAKNSLATLSQVKLERNDSGGRAENDVIRQKVVQVPISNARLAKYAKLIIDQPSENKQKWYKVMSVDEEGRAFTSSLRYVSSNMGSVILTVSLTVILVGICLFLIYRQTNRKPKLFGSSSGGKSSQQPQPYQHKQKHLRNKTLPRALQQTCPGTM